MREQRIRQATLVGLAVFFLATLIRTTWVLGAPVREATAELADLAPHLQGLVVVVDPGHGGSDPGAVVKGTREKDLTLNIGLLLKALLEEQGAKVVMTRTTDKDLGGTIREELSRRVAIVKESRADLYVSIHANRDSCNCWGAQTFYQKAGTPEGKALAMAIQDQLRRLTPTTRHALAADYYVLRTSPVPSAIVEVGFLTSGQEHAKLLQPDYQKVLATAIALGIADYRKARASGQSPGKVPGE